MGKKSRSRTRANHEEFVGLYNQGATCYLNTLLQTLYMTPEVKETIISFIEKTNEKINQDTSICYQLKELFAQLDAKQIANTRGITRNLGMSQQEVFKQQDIEEYFRLLLNKVVTESDGSCNILQIYQSKVINSLKCLECNIEAPEECILLDIPLPIHSFGCRISFQSVNESFQEFLKVDTLSGDNMCYCETCQKKTETETRYYFESLPQILALKLKRFEFDYFKMSFTKLQDVIEIPPTLTFQKKKNKDIDKTEWCLISMESKEAKKTELKKRQSSSLGPQPSKRSRNDESEESQKLLKDGSQQEVQEQEGPLQSNKHTKNECYESHESRKDDSQQSYTAYELFAICHHSGGYGSGHYVACIKPVSSSKWYCFNDTSVTEMEDFSGTRHGSTVSTSGMPCERSSTAYMLMYRKEEVNSNQGDNADEEKESNQPMTMRDENGSHELGGMGDGEDNHYQSSQPPDQNLEDPPEKNATEAKEGNETTGRIENRKCGMKEKERQTQEMDVAKEGGMVMKEKSTETDEMVTTGKAQGEQCQIGSKENVMREKENVGHLKDSEGKTVENVTGTEKENRNATQIKSVTDKNTPNLDESVPGNNDKLKEELMENNADDKNIKEGKEAEEKNLYVKTDKVEDKKRVQERKHTIGQKEPELEQEEQKRMEQTSQSEGLQHVKRVEITDIKQPKGCKKQIDTEQNEYSKREEKIIGEKENQEEEKKSLLVETKKEEGRREQTSKNNVEENRIEELPKTENGKATFRTETSRWFKFKNFFRKKENSKNKRKSKARFSCLRGMDKD